MVTIILSSTMLGEKRWLLGGKESSFVNSPVRREFRQGKETRVVLTARSNWSRMPESLPDSRKSNLETPIHGKTGILFLLPLKLIFKITSM